MKKIRLKAMAKINLGLDVVGKREDGYHEVKMIMQTIRMYDQIELESTEEPGIRVRIICRPMRTTWCIRQRSF